MSDEPFDCPNPPGFINSRVSFSDRNGQRLILVNAQTYYCYQLDDRLTARFIWVQMQLAGHASFVEIARAIAVPLRTLQSWKARFARGGFEALINKSSPGRPRGLTPQHENQILDLLGKGHSHEEIAQRVGVSGSGIDRVIVANKRTSPSQPTLGQDDLSWETPAINPQEQAEQLQEESQTCEQTHSEPTDDSPRLLADKPAQSCAHTAQEHDVENHWSGDPLNRATDRAFARVGLLEDAEPQFAEGDDIRFCGWFMIAALLEEDPLLEGFQQVYDRHLTPAFYGLRTVVMTLLMMALLRIKRPEHLRSYNPVSLGRILGLDRVMEVKTLRRKLHTLAAVPRGVELMDKLAEARSCKRLSEEQDAWRTVYFDGHVQAYWGKMPIGQTWSATANRTVKGRTDTWVNLDDQRPLFYITASFNQGMKDAVIKSHEKIVEMLGKNVILVFDREVWDMTFLRELDQLDLRFITYRKGAFEPLAEDRFPEQPTKIGKRDYAHAPVDQQQSYNLYEKTYDKTKGRAKSRKIGEVTFREIRLLREDGKQTAVVTNIDSKDQTNEQVIERIIGRWANQENIFKYMIEEFSLDALLEYNRVETRGPRAGDQQIPAEDDHPNPEYNKLTKELGSMRKEREKLLAKYGLIYEELGEKSVKQEDELAKMIEKITQLREGADGKRLDEVNAQIEIIQSKRAETKQRTSVAEAGYMKLRSGIKQIADTIKISAYHLESQLYEMLAPHYANTEKEGRKLLAAALRSNGTIRLEEKKIVVRLEEQASPNRTAAINGLCRELTERCAKYPGTDLVIEFDTEHQASA